jgi:hypothetical protein
MRENKYYTTIDSWLHEAQGCFHVHHDCGTKLARADVVGVCQTGGELASDYELIAVEVKTEEPFFRSICQAAGYSIFAHRCYLAEYDRGRGGFGREKIEIALSLGIGLLKIHSRKQVSVELHAPQRTPRRRFALRMLEAMGLAECILCRGVFKGTYKAGVKRADREDVQLMLRRAVDAEPPKGFLFWSDGAAEKKGAAGEGDECTTRRYVCPDCLTNLVGPLLPDDAAEET